MKVHRSGYYQWLNNPISKTEQENIVILNEIKKSYKKSNCIYGYRNVHKDLVELGFKVNKKRVARLMSKAHIYGLGMYKRKPKSMAGPLHKAHPNLLKQYFVTSNPNEAWVSDITYIRTKEGWLYLATVLDLFSRKIIGWQTGGRQTTDLIENALSKAVLRISKKESNVILHSDQGSQYSSYDYVKYAKKHNIKLSMSRRGNCYDNAVAESFFKTIKKELVRKKVFKTREEASSKIFEYIEMFYNSKRRHSYVGSISPNEFEKRYNEKTSK
jgi:putative transposase